ncbi:MAG: hypothetical protein NZ923_07070 [Candidatus Kryptonium sp.]|nr:hypothetical protein [Candidatus Kryptonium sp.]
MCYFHYKNNITKIKSQEPSKTFKKCLHLRALLFSRAEKSKNLIFSKRILYLSTKKTGKNMAWNRKNIFELVRFKIIGPINLEGT